MLSTSPRHIQYAYPYYYLAYELAHNNNKILKVPWLRLFALSKPEAVYYLPAILGAILSGLAMPLEALFLARALNFFFDPDVNSMMNGIQQTSLG